MFFIRANWIRRTGAALIAIGSCGQLHSEEFNSALPWPYQDPGFSHNRDFSASQQPDTIDPFSGQLKMVIEDLRLPGNGGLDISVVRNYQSVTNLNGPYNNGHSHRTPFGTGWDMHFGRLWRANTSQHALSNASSNNTACQTNNVKTSLNPVLELPDGSREVLANGNGSDHAYISRNRWIGRCLPSTANSFNDGGLLVYSPDGTEYTFNRLGATSPDKQYLAYFVTKIKDTKGNTLTLTYTSKPLNSYEQYTLLKKITASDGRSVDFNYTDEGGVRPRLSSISGEGKRVNYNYDDAQWFSGTNWLPHYLSQVDYPDGTSWKYSYKHQKDWSGAGQRTPGLFSLTTMTSPTGLSTSYEYEYRQMGDSQADNANIVVKKTLGTGSALTGTTSTQYSWTYQYTKGYYPNNDQTVEIGPNHCTRYTHVGTNTITSAPLNPGAWRVGLLMKKEILPRNGSGCSNTALRTETNEWGSQSISTQNEQKRFGYDGRLILDTGVNAPQLSKKTITQNGSSHITTFTYDIYAQPTQIVEDGPKDRTTTISYVRPGNNWILGKVATQAVSGVSGNIANTYSSNGLLTQQNAYGVITTYGYTSDGDLTSVTDANSKVTSHTDYYRGVARKTTFPDSTVQTRTVNPRGTIATSKDELGRVTSYTYDAMDRLASITPPKGATAKSALSYVFASTGVTETLTRGAYKRVRNYNQLGHLYNQTETAAGTNIVVSAKYDALGQRTFLSHPNYGSTSGYGESFAYDALGRLTTATHGDGTSASRSYSGSNVTLTDERGKVTTQGYSAFGEPNEALLSSITQPGNIETSITHDNLGRVTAIAQGGLTRSFTFNAKGFLGSETHPETGTTTYTHDLVGNVLSKKIGTAAADTYAYDNRYRLKTITYGGTSLVLGNTYDNGGRVTQRSFNGTTWDYSYDSHDKLLSEKLTLTSPAKSYTFGYSYDALDNLTSLTYPSGQVVGFAPDAFGRATQAGSYASALSYHANGSLSGLTYGNGRRLTIALDAKRQRVSERYVAGANLPMQLRYGFDAASNITSISDLQNSGYNQTLTYDDLNRLKTAAGVWGSASFAYNARGDLTSQSIAGRNLTYGYDAQGRLSSLSGSIAATLGYDAKGNVLTARGQYGFDSAGNLNLLCLSARADCTSSPDQRYSYDGNSRRVLETFADGEQVISAYGLGGQLLRQDNLLDDGYQEYIYVAGERIAEKMQCSETDSDGDGLPNCYERRYEFNRKDPSDGAADSDSDGLSNGREYALGTEPLNRDSDWDGMPDGWEVGHGLNPKAADGAFDPDGDGRPNAVEFALGSNPKQQDAPARVPTSVEPAIDLLLN